MDNFSAPNLDLQRLAVPDLNAKLNATYPGKVVRKDLTSRIKEGANVPIYVLEYLLGMYCATDDEATIEEGRHARQEDPRGELRPPRRGRAGQEPGAGTGALHRDRPGDGQAQREGGPLRDRADEPGRDRDRDRLRRHPGQRETAGRRHLVHPGPGIRRLPPAQSLSAGQPQAHPDAVHRHGRVACGPRRLHPRGVDRRPAALGRSGTHGLPGERQVAPAGPHGAARREQLQLRRTRPALHRQEPRLQGNQSQLAS